jgi:hypothetical protein
VLQLLPNQHKFLPEKIKKSPLKNAGFFYNLPSLGVNKSVSFGKIKYEMHIGRSSRWSA